MFECLDFVLKCWQKDILSVSKTYFGKLKALSEHKCKAAVLGLQSSGKSTLLNGIIGYPVLPVTEIKGTTCPLTLEYGGQPLLTAITDSGAKVEINGLFTGDVFEKLIEYVCTCVNKHIFFPENILYFMPENCGYDSLSPSDVIMDSKDNKHGLVLAMILLSSYIENDNSKDYTSQLRGKIIEILGIKGRLNSLHLTWPSESIPKNLCLIDLPGLGSESSSGNDKYSLDAIAEHNASKADVILFMTTAEAVGGHLQKVCRNIYSEPGEYGPPLSVIVINRADEVEHAAVTINAAKAMMPSMSVPVYMISSAAGEYRYLGAAVPIEKTLYWRRTFLPDFRKYLQRENITESDKEAAVNELRELYNLEYEYGREDTDGNIAALSLNSFINTELKTLCAQRLSQMLLSVYSSDPQCRRLMDKLAARDIAFMNKKHEYIAGVWEAMTEKARELLRKLAAELTDTINVIISAMNAYSADCGKLRRDFNNMLMSINTAFSEKVTSAASALYAKWGLSLCTSIDGQAEINSGNQNDRVIHEIYSACSASELMILMNFTAPVEGQANEIFYRAEKICAEAAAHIYGAFSAFTEKIRELPDTCMNEFAVSGINNDTFKRYFHIPLYTAAENIIEAVMKNCPSHISPEGHKKCRFNLGLGRRIRCNIDEAMRSAVLFRLKGNNIVLRKKKLVRELRKALISSADAEQLYLETGLPVDHDDSKIMLKELHKKCIDAQNEIKVLTDMLQSVLTLAYQECGQAIEQDNILLNEWLSQVK